MLKNLGQRIRTLRKKRNITLVDMAEKTGVAQATLSRIETGSMTGTVESHEKISEVLGIGLAELYTGVDRRYEEIEHIDHSAPRPVAHQSSAFKLELLTQESSRKKITPMLITIQAESEVPQEKSERGVEKFFYVLEGNVSVQVENESFELKEQETLYFDASLPHTIKNPHQGRAKLLVAVSPSKL